MKIGYVRVSSLDQNTIRQEVIMKDLGAEEIFIDKLSGKDTNRSELQKMIAFARKGDAVIVESISRFARNTKDLLTLIDLLTEKGVEFVSKKENIDTTTPTGKFMLTVFGAVAELEREYILQRQKEGIAIAKSQGKYMGRKRIENVNFDVVYDKWQAKEVTGIGAMKILNMKKSTFYRRVNEKNK
jgi:DNA invertase Pin-like site-specific DNA recombinase